MGVRVGILFLAVLAANCAVDARELSNSDSSEQEAGTSYTSVMQIFYTDSEKVIQSSDEIGTNEGICRLCEEFTAKAIKYLNENKTQTDIIDIFHKSCSRMISFKQQCIILVDYYAPLFFSEISKMQPESFCLKVDLCEETVAISNQFSNDKCGFCHQAVGQVLLKLKDPRTKLALLGLLLKGCDAVETYAKKCKRMVFEYAPLVIVNAEKFMEKHDICAMLHACDSAAVTGLNQEQVMAKTPMVSTS